MAIVDVIDTALNVMCVIRDGFGARPPVHVIVVAPLRSVALPAVMVRELGVVTNAPTVSKPEPESASVGALEPEPESEPVVHDDG